MCNNHNNNEGIHCPYCGELIHIIEAWHASGAWDVVLGVCSQHKFLEMEIECYGECVEDMLDDNLLTSTDGGTKLDGVNYEE